MSDKYIIRNCPAILKMSKVCDDYRTTRDNPELCKNINDCVMKQIVELLQQYDEEDCNWCEPISFNTENIYELLKIQEVD